MLQVQAGGNAPVQLVHVARQTLLPSSNKPAKPAKPTAKPTAKPRMPTKPQDLPSDGGTESASPAPQQLETVRESDPAGTEDVVATIPEFGDLASSSPTEPAADQGRPGAEAPQTAEQGAAAAAPDHAAVDASAAAGAAAVARSAKPRPPVKKKPSKITT